MLKATIFYEVFYENNIMLMKEAKTMFEWAVKNNQNNYLAKEGLSKVNVILGFNEIHNTLLEDE